MKKANFKDYVNSLNEFYRNVVTEDVIFKLFILDFFEHLKALSNDKILDFLRSTSLYVKENRAEAMFGLIYKLPNKDEYLRKLFLRNISDIRIKFCKEYIVGGNTNVNC